MSGKARELVRLFVAPRGRAGKEFRISLDEFSPEDGDPKSYVSLRVWFRGGDKMLPGKSGTTIRRGELRKAIEALEKAERIMLGQEPASARQPSTGLADDYDAEQEDRELF